MLTERTTDGYFQICRGDSIIVIRELLLDELPGVLGVPLPLLDEPLQQLVRAELLHQPDADHPVLAVVRRPLDIHHIVQSRGQLKI